LKIVSFYRFFSPSSFKLRVQQEQQEQEQEEQQYQ